MGHKNNQTKIAPVTATESETTTEKVTSTDENEKNKRCVLRSSYVNRARNFLKLHGLEQTTQEPHNTHAFHREHKNITMSRLA